MSCAAGGVHYPTEMDGEDGWQCVRSVSASASLLTSLCPVTTVRGPCWCSAQDSTDTSTPSTTTNWLQPGRDTEEIFSDIFTLDRIMWDFMRRYNSSV